jgi:hypothetical protein
VRFFALRHRQHSLPKGQRLRPIQVVPCTSLELHVRHAVAANIALASAQVTTSETGRIFDVFSPVRTPTADVARALTPRLSPGDAPTTVARTSTPMKVASMMRSERGEASSSPYRAAPPPVSYSHPYQHRSQWVVRAKHSRGCSATSILRRRAFWDTVPESSNVRGGDRNPTFTAPPAPRFPRYAPLKEHRHARSSQGPRLRHRSALVYERPGYEVAHKRR